MTHDWSAADVLAFFEKQPESELISYKSELMQALYSPSMFSQVMSFITPPQREQLFNLLKDELSAKVETVDDFVQIALYLNPEQRQQLWSHCSEICPKSLKDLAKLLQLLEPKSYPKLLESASGLQKTGVEFGMLLGMLTITQRQALQDWISQSLPDLIILSSEDFKNSMQYLNDNQKRVLFDRVWLTLPGMIENSHGFKRVFSCLSHAQSDLLLLSVDLSKICDNTLDKVEVLKSLHKHQLKRLYIGLPENAYHWGILLGELELNKAKLLLAKYPKSLHHGQAFAEMQMFNTPEVRNRIFDLFQHKLSLLIRHCDDMLWSFTYLDGGQRDYLWQRFAHEVHKWIKEEPAFFRLFANEHSDLFQFFQQLPHRHGFVMALLSEKPERIKQQFEQLLKPMSKPGGQFFTPLSDRDVLLDALKLLHPRRCALLNQSLCLHLNKKDELSQEAFIRAMHAILYRDKPNKGYYQPAKLS